MMEGVEVCVMGGSASIPKAPLERRVWEAGGCITQHPTGGTRFIVCEVGVFPVSEHYRL